MNHGVVRVRQRPAVRSDTHCSLLCGKSCLAAGLDLRVQVRLDRRTLPSLGCRTALLCGLPTRGFTSLPAPTRPVTSRVLLRAKLSVPAAR